jgi:hypothetical protein
LIATARKPKPENLESAFRKGRHQDTFPLQPQAVVICAYCSHVKEIAKTPPTLRFSWAFFLATDRD